MRIMSLVEQLFFLLDKQKQPMHVGGLFLFELPVINETQTCSNFVENLVEQLLKENVPPVFPFNQVVHNLTFWKQQDNIDITKHVHYINLECSGEPCLEEDVVDYVSKLHSTPLDKSRPLWECHIIEGIIPISSSAPQRFGMYFKIHHSVVDGIAAMRLVQKALSSSANDMMHLPPWALLDKKNNSKYSIDPPDRSAVKVIKEQVKTFKPVLSELKNSFKSRHKREHVSVTQAPNSLINQRISEARQLITHSFTLARFERTAACLNVSINDIAIAVCSGALRQYLITQNALPSDPLIAAVPMSLRKDNSATGNQASLVLCNLGTHINDPLKRLSTIKESMRAGKDRFNRMTQAEVINYSGLAYAWEGVNLLTGAYPKKQAFNLLISNVPGPKETLYWNGAKLTALYPASVLLHGQALNMTLISYLDRMDFGIVACQDVLPDTPLIADFLNQQLMTYEKLCY